MPQQTRLQIALILCLGFAVVGIRGDAQEKGGPDPKSATAQARRDAAQKVYEGILEHNSQGSESATWNDYHVWSVRWLQADRDLAGKKADDIAAVERHLKRMQAKRDSISKAVKSQFVPTFMGNAADFFVLEAEDLLADARAK